MRKKQKTKRNKDKKDINIFGVYYGATKSVFVKNRSKRKRKNTKPKRDRLRTKSIT